MGDALLTVCHLINYMPSSVLNNQIPYFILNPKQDLHIVPLRVFGSTCFVHDLKLGKNKLSTKSLKFIFLGYSRHQKGYRCFSPQLQWYLASTSVIFFETTHLFSSIIEDIPLEFPHVVPAPFINPAQLHLHYAHTTNRHRQYRQHHLMILQHHLLLQTHVHHRCLYLNSPLPYPEVFGPLIILILYMFVLLTMIVYLSNILLSLLWILCLFPSL